MVVVSEGGRVLLVWMRGALGQSHEAARAEARRHHHVSGGWAKGCAAEPVASPERVVAMFKSLVRLRAYGLNGACTFVRLEPKGSGYRCCECPHACHPLVP